MQQPPFNMLQKWMMVNGRILKLLFLAGVIYHLFMNVNANAPGTQRPIIGIVTVDIDSTINKKFNMTGESDLPTSYVKYIEMGGARVVPIFLNRTVDYYTTIFQEVNGILFPGGGISLENSSYGQAARILYDLAVKENENGTYFPLWGTCLGFEMLARLIDNETLLKNCSAYNVSMPLELKQGFYQSRLFHSVPSAIVASLLTKNVTANFHKHCIPTPDEAPQLKLWSNINVLSLNKDTDGLSFVSTFEDKQYPFYGVQWHPEKATFEWTTMEPSIPHDIEAIQVAQYFANFFVGEARKNNHKYKDVMEEEEALISNFNRKNYYFLHNITTTMKERYIFFKEE